MNTKVFNEILVFSGAGLSAESGLSTYRDQGGIWQTYDLNKVCNEDTWQKNYALMHEFYNHARTAVGQAQPNAAHHEIARWQKHFGDRLHIITQNVDDLLERAGCQNVMHVHGEITKMRCEHCDVTWSVGYKPWLLETSMCCTDDRQQTRPDVVFFGGQAPLYGAMYATFERVTRSADNLVIVIGTNGEVVPVQALLEGKPCQKVLCNLYPSKFMLESMFDHVYEEAATVALPKISHWLIT